MQRSLAQACRALLIGAALFTSCAPAPGSNSSLAATPGPSPQAQSSGVASPAVAAQAAQTAPAPAGPAAKTGLGAITGRVYRSDTGTGLANVRVTLLRRPDAGLGSPTASTRTDGEGKYAFEDLAPGSYGVTIQIEFPPSQRPPCDPGNNIRSTGNVSFALSKNGLGLEIMYLSEDTTILAATSSDFGPGFSDGPGLELHNAARRSALKDAKVLDANVLPGESQTRDLDLAC